MCFICVENRDGEAVGLFATSSGQDLDVTSTRKWRRDTRESGMSVWQKITALSVKSSLLHRT